eukprot:gene3133-3601_t
MSLRAISNSSLIRVSSFNSSDAGEMYKKTCLPSDLLDYLNNLFITLDPSCTGFMDLNSLETYWKLKETGYKLLWLKRKHGVEHMTVLSLLRQTVHSSCLVSHRKLIQAVEMVVARKGDASQTKSVFSDRVLRERQPKATAIGQQQRGDFGGALREKTTMNVQERGPDWTNKIQWNMIPVQQRAGSCASTSTQTGVGGNSENAMICSSKSSLQQPGLDFGNKKAVVVKTENTKRIPKDYHQVFRVKSKSEVGNGRPKPRDLTKEFENSRHGSSSSSKFIELDCIIDDVSKQIKTMQKCLTASENAGKWCSKRIACLQKDKMELRRLVYMGKNKDEVKKKIETMKAHWNTASNGVELQSHLKTITSLNQKLKAHNIIDNCNNHNDNLRSHDDKENCSSNDQSGTESVISSDAGSPLEKKLEEQSKRITQLEEEKALLVKDLFHMKGKLDFIARPVEQLVPPEIKKRMTLKGTMMIGYQPLKDLGNFFRMVVVSAAVTIGDMDFVLDEIERLGHDL